MSKKRRVIEEVKIPWYRKVKRSTWIMAAIITGIILASAGIIIYDQLDTYTKLDYDKTIKVGKYEGVKGTLTKVTVTDEDVKAEIDQRLQKEATTKIVKKGKVKDGDTLIIDYKGKVDGEEFEGGTAEKQELTIGSGAMIPGFEDALIGKKIGKKCTISVTFPEDYNAQELAGKDAEFEIKIRSKKEQIPPEYNEKFIKKHSKYKTKKDYEASIKKKLTKERKEEAENQLKEDLWAKVLEKSKVKKYPKDLLAEETELVKKQYEQMASQYGSSPEAMGITEDQYKEFAKESLKEKLALHAIAKKEHLRVSKSDRKVFYKKMLKENSVTEKQFKKYTGMTVEEYVKANDMEIQILRDKVLDFVRDNAKVTEKEAEPEAEE